MIKLSTFLTVGKKILTLFKCSFRKVFFEKKLKVLPKSMEYVLISKNNGSYLTVGDELMIVVYMVGGIVIAS